MTNPPYTGNFSVGNTKTNEISKLLRLDINCETNNNFHLGNGKVC